MIYLYHLLSYIYDPQLSVLFEKQIGDVELGMFSSVIGTSCFLNNFSKMFVISDRRFLGRCKEILEDFCQALKS